MKDITHYFTDLSRKSKDRPVALKEVKDENAKINSSKVAVNQEPRLKGCQQSNETAVCDIVDSYIDLVDKTSSSDSKCKRIQNNPDNFTPERITFSKSFSELNVQGKNPIKNRYLEDKSTSNKLSSKTFDDLIQHADQINNAKTKRMESETEKNSLEIRKMKFEERETEKLIKLVDKKGYLKRKIVEEEAAKIEKRLPKRKKLFTVESIKTSNTAQIDKNTLENRNSFQTVSKNLFNYFSKATPEQLEKERLLKRKVIIKAEIHTSQNSIIPADPIFDKRKDLSKKNDKSKQSQEEFDEIHLIRSETLVLPPKHEKSLIQQYKPKWSLKIQLPSNINKNVPGKVNDNDEIYTLTTSNSQKENIKSSDKIPKILLPIKNKKGELNNTSLDNHASKKKEVNKNLMVYNQEKSKTEKIKTEANQKFENYSTAKKCITSSVSLNKETTNEECQIIEDNFLNRKTKEKLAPLFTKKIKLNTDIIIGQCLFSQSNIHENNTNDIQKPSSVDPIKLPFPQISHINQFSTDSKVSNQTLNLSLKRNKKFKSSFDLIHMKTVSRFNNIVSISENLYECGKLDNKATLSENDMKYKTEMYCSDVQILWKSISTLSKYDNSKQMLKIRQRASNKKYINSPWTVKYKPNNSAEIVSNEEAASKLKSWLDSWKLKNNEDYSSGEEFYTSDCSISSNTENNQVAVLIGPCGSGKTACVYAIAHELGYKVLEVNASSKRPGKKILKDFEEATKSHRIKKSNLEDILTILKKSEENKISQNSLILMEDIDLVFEQDEGFVSSTFQLASNTKRPIVMTLRDTCSYLSKMAPQQFRIEFHPVTGKRVLALLQLITWAETGRRLSQNCLDTLCQSGDLRKGLLQLQYLLLSGKKCSSSTTFAVNELSWKDVQTFIYKSAIKTGKDRKKIQIFDDEYFQDNILDNLVNNLHTFILLTMLINIEDPTSYLIDIKYEPSISLIENTKLYSSLENTSLEIGNWLNDVIKKKSFSNQSKILNIKVDITNYQLLTMKQISSGVNSKLSQIVTNRLDQPSVSVDYLSSIRTICRTEEIRNRLNNKRGNRFFHYLQSSKLSNGIKSSNILSAACKMLQEKPTAIVET